MKLYRSLQLVNAAGEMRTAVFEEREHLVVPVVALVEGVIWPINAPGRELVLAEEFTKSFQGWNGEPVVADHPAVGDDRVSANDPRILEQYAFGRCFGTKVEDASLKMEAWMDPVKAARIGSRATDILERMRNGETVEVSVGVFVTAEEKSGEYNGVPYTAVWREIVPDHLAMLPAGATGACSVEMGCGAPRAATRYLIVGGGYRSVDKVDAPATTVQEVPMGDEQPKKPTQRNMARRLIDYLRMRVGAASEMSDGDLRNALDYALRAIEPGYICVDAVYPASNEVVYAVAPTDYYTLYRRTFSLAADNSVTLKDDRVEVEPVMTYEPVTAATSTTTTSTPPTAAALDTTGNAAPAIVSAEQPKPPCSCADRAAEAAATPSTSESAPTAQGESTMKTKAERVTALIQSKKLGPAVTQKFLEGLTDEQLAEVEASAESIKPEEEVVTPPAAPVATPVATPAAETPAATPALPVAAAAKPLTEAEYLAQAPETIRTLVAEKRAQDAARKLQLVTTLKTAQKEYTEAELTAMDVAQLERIARVASAAVPEIDYSQRGFPRAAVTVEDEEAAPPPIDLSARIRAARGVTVQ